MLQVCRNGSSSAKYRCANGHLKPYSTTLSCGTKCICFRNPEGERTAACLYNVLNVGTDHDAKSSAGPPRLRDVFNGEHVASLVNVRHYNGSLG